MPTLAGARMARVEAALSPTQRVVRWLDEAHAYGSLDAYVAALVDEPPERYPLTRLLREAKASVRSDPASRRGKAADDAVRTALRETAFRFELVLRINITTHEMLDRQALVGAALGAQLALLALDCRPTSEPDPTHDRRLGQCLSIADASVIELMAVEQARGTVEGRFLAGHPALFPDEVSRFTGQLHETQRLTVMAMRLAELDGVPPGEPGSPDAVAKRAETLVRDLIEPSRVTALEKLGDGRQAMTIATNWVRRSLPTDGPAESPDP
jgi:hypothetical protein